MYSQFSNIIRRSRFHPKNGRIFADKIRGSYLRISTDAIKCDVDVVPFHGDVVVTLKFIHVEFRDPPVRARSIFESISKMLIDIRADDYATLAVNFCCVSRSRSDISGLSRVTWCNARIPRIDRQRLMRFESSYYIDEFGVDCFFSPSLPLSNESLTSTIRTLRAATRNSCEILFSLQIKKKKQKKSYKIKITN